MRSTPTASCSRRAHRRGGWLALLACGAFAAASAGHAATAPSSVDCAAPGSSVETAICGDDALAALDKRLVTVYATASRTARADERNRLAAEQQSWLEDRNRCAGAADRATCIKEHYVHRIADLQAQFKLVGSRGPFRFECNGPGNVLVAQFFETDPATARFTHGGRTVTAFVARSGSGARYEGPTVSYWEHQGEASVVWFGRKLKCSTR